MRRVVVVPLLCLAVGLSSFAVSPSRAAVPGVVSFQGILKRPNGLPVVDGTYSVKFALYNGLLSTTAVWTETLSVATTNGLYSVLLGAGTAIPASALTGDDYLEVTVAGNILSPRQRLSAGPYAIRSGVVDTVNGASGGSVSGSITASGSVSGQGLSIKLFNTPIAIPGIQGTGASGLGGEAPGILAVGANSGTGTALVAQGDIHVTGDAEIDGTLSGNPSTNSLQIKGNVALDGKLDTPFSISANGQIDAWAGLSSHHDISATYDVKSRTVHADHVYATGFLAPDYDTGIQTLNPGSNATFTLTAFLTEDVSDCFVDAQEISDATDGSERAYFAPVNFHVRLFDRYTDHSSRLVVYWNNPPLNTPIKYRVRIWKKPV